VTLTTSSSAFLEGTVTLEYGTYEFPNVSAGTYDVEFEATGYFGEWYDNAGSAAAGSVTAAVSEFVTANAALTPDIPDPGSISGTLSVDSDLLGGGSLLMSQSRCTPGRQS